MTATIKKHTTEDFARLVYDIAKSDRDPIVAVSGMTGEGKSVFMVHLVKAYQKLRGEQFSFECMTWDYKELIRWIDGEGDEKKGQLPEFSPIIVDELISLFFKRNWYMSEQKNIIELLNKFRDRHLLLVGGVPVFRDLDSAFRNRVRFWVFIEKRGKAWVLKKETNPFTDDPWNIQYNFKLWRKGQMHKSPNLVGIIEYPDLDEYDKKEYYDIRNKKRIGTEGQYTSTKEKKKLRDQRNDLIKLIWKLKEQKKVDISQQELASLLDMTQAEVSMIIAGKR